MVRRFLSTKQFPIFLHSRTDLTIIIENTGTGDNQSLVFPFVKDTQSAVDQFFTDDFEVTPGLGNIPILLLPGALVTITGKLEVFHIGVARQCSVRS